MGPNLYLSRMGICTKQDLWPPGPRHWDMTTHFAHWPPISILDPLLCTVDLNSKDTCKLLSHALLGLTPHVYFTANMSDLVPSHIYAIFTNKSSQILLYVNDFKPNIVTYILFSFFIDWYSVHRSPYTQRYQGKT